MIACYDNYEVLPRTEPPELLGFQWNQCGDERDYKEVECCGLSYGRMVLGVFYEVLKSNDA